MLAGDEKTQQTLAHTWPTDTQVTQNNVKPYCKGHACWGLEYQTGELGLEESANSIWKEKSVRESLYTWSAGWAVPEAWWAQSTEQSGFYPKHNQHSDKWAVSHFQCSTLNCTCQPRRHESTEITTLKSEWTARSNCYHSFNADWQLHQQDR